MTPLWTAPSGRFNAAVDLIARNLPHNADRVAIIDRSGRWTFAQVADRARRAAALLGERGVGPGDRVALVLRDSADFVALFLGTILSGAIPVPLNTLLNGSDYRYILADSQARLAVVASDLASLIGEVTRGSGWGGELIVEDNSTPPQTGSLQHLLNGADAAECAHPTCADDIAFWLYSSGSTGAPKGTPHRHASLAATAELFGRRTLGLRADDVVFSAAKLFFAYGLGNSLTFPMSVGATVVLCQDRVTPALVARTLVDHEVSVFCGVPTLYQALLASGDLASAPALRLCLSAGEALPESIGSAWRARMGIDILDGIGSTEMLHIFVSNRPGEVRPGVTGIPVPGYEAVVLDDARRPVRPGELGELFVRGPSMTPGYWNQPDKTAATFVDGWMRTGDKFRLNDDESLTYCGRVDDMLKVGGIWVSPAEVESTLVAHEGVLEAAVIGVEDADGLVRSKAFVVLRPHLEPDQAMARTLQAFVKGRLAPQKYPREIAFVPELPKTATGKVRRHVLREWESTRPERSK